MKAPNVLAVFHCATCGKHALEPLKPNHMAAGDCLSYCGGAVEQLAYEACGAAVTPSLRQGAVVSRKRSSRRSAKTLHPARFSRTESVEKPADAGTIRA